jgi:hypothetical protein
MAGARKGNDDKRFHAIALRMVGTGSGITFVDDSSFRKPFLML